MQNIGSLNEFLLSGVMWLWCLRFGGLFGWFFFGLEPFGVKNAGLIEALVGVRAKEIALRL